MASGSELGFLHDLAVVLGVAAVTTVLFQRLKQPVVLGYLLAGLIVGPHTFGRPFVSDVQVVHTLSELGIVLLLFSLGLEFSFRRLLRVGPAAGLVTILQVGFMLWLGYTIGQLLGWGAVESLFVGAIISVSSTTVILKAFDEQGMGNKREPFTELVTGILIGQDLVAILLLALLTAVGTGASLSVRDFAGITGRLAGFLVALIGIGLLVVPRTFRAIVRLGSSETLLVASVGFCFAISLLALRAGYSVALGAFIAGALVAESGKGTRVAHLVEPVRDVFAAVFFVSVGMLIEPVALAENWPLVLVLTALTIVGMTLTVSGGSFLAGRGIRTSVRSGMSMAQIGEFSIIIARLGIGLKAVREELYPVVVAVVAITAFTTPWMIRGSDRSAAWVDRRLPKPLQTFATLYSAWLEEIGEARKKRGDTGWGRIRRTSQLLLLDSALLLAIVVGFSSGMASIGGWSEAQLGIDGALARALVAGLALLLAIPFLVGIVRCARTIGVTLAIEALPDAQTSLDLAAAPRRALVVAIQLAVLVALGMPMLALTQPFLPPFRGALVLALVLAVLGVAFWRSATNLQGHVRAGSMMIVEVLAKQGTPAAASSSATARGLDPIDQIQAILPGFGSLIRIRLEAASPAVGKSLAELNLRGLTGASVLAIVRDGEQVVNPTASERLRANDVLALVGTTDAEKAAQRLLIGPV